MLKQSALYKVFFKGIFTFLRESNMNSIRSFVFIGSLFFVSSIFANSKSNCNSEIWYVNVPSWGAWEFEWIKSSGDIPGPEYFQEIAIPPSPWAFSALETMYRGNKTSGNVVSYRTNCNPADPNCACTWTGFIDSSQASGTVTCPPHSAVSWKATIVTNNNLKKCS